MPVKTTIKTRSAGRPRAEDVADIDHRLLAVATQEFLEHGYGGASVSRIVKNAKMSKATVYSRFESKEALFRGIMAEHITQLAPEKFLSVEAETLDLQSGLHVYADHMLALSTQPEMAGVNRLMYTEAHRFPELAKALEQRRRAGIKRVSRFISQCAEHDGIACQAPDAAAEVFFTLVRGWYMQVLLSGRKVTARQRRQWVESSVALFVASRSQW